MVRRKDLRLGAAWFELLLAIAFVILLFQVFPRLWNDSIWLIDVRNWSRTSLLLVNLLVIMALGSIRLWPSIVHSWQDRSEKRSAERMQREKRAALKEQKETLARLKEGQKRRLY
jgi:hypothetical protein